MFIRIFYYNTIYEASENYFGVGTNSAYKDKN